MATINGTPGPDLLDGTPQADTISGLAGNDFLRGKGDSDRLFGNQDNDTLVSGKGNDIASGGAGNDRIFGDRGNDVLNGDRGIDTLTGGSGRDVFAIGQGADIITDFVKGLDAIALTNGLNFNSINIAAGTGSNAGNTVITNRQNGEIVAILQGVDSRSITPIDFTANLTPLPPPVVTAGTNLANARNLGAIAPAPQSVSDFVGDDNPENIYRFSLTGPTKINANLTGLRADADLSLIQDINGNGRIDSQDILDVSENEGNESETITKDLLPGNYFLTVEQFEGDTNYNLSISGTPVSAPPDASGNTVATARNVTLSETSQTFSDSLSDIDSDDYYRINITSQSDVNLRLTFDSATENTDVDLLFARDDNGDGQIDDDEIIEVSENPQASPEQISLNALKPGQYIVLVEESETDSGSTNYTLEASATPDNTPAAAIPPSTTPGYNSFFGYGNINAAAAVARAAGRPSPYPDVPDITGAVDNNNVSDLNRIKSPAVWNQGITGKGIIVAVLDTGVDVKHPDLAKNIWVNSREIAGNGVDDDNNGFIDDINGYNFSDNTPDPAEVPGERGFGHGTHVAGTIAGLRNGAIADANDTRYDITGVAYDAQIMAVRVLGGKGGAGRFASPVAAGIDYAVANGAKVINMSLGVPGSDADQPEDQPATRAALERARQAGVHVVAIAAGNNRNDFPPGQVTRPASPSRLSQDNLAVSVGALDSRDLQFADFSNPAGVNPITFISAPGVGVLSATPNNTYGSKDGTSMATPHVAGLMALMLQANPNLSPSQLEQILIQTANPSGITVV